MVGWHPDDWSAPAGFSAIPVHYDGTVLTSFPISFENNSHDDLCLAGGAGTVYASWSDQRATNLLYGSRLADTGSPTDVPSVQIQGSEGSSPRCVRGQSGSLVVAATGGSVGNITAVRVDGITGAVVDATPIVVNAGSGWGSQLPDVAFANGMYMVIWEDWRSSGSGGDSGIYLAAIFAPA